MPLDLHSAITRKIYLNKRLLFKVTASQLSKDRNFREYSLPKEEKICSTVDGRL